MKLFVNHYACRYQVSACRLLPLYGFFLLKIIFN